jgi:hypothetical protein
MLIRRDPIPWKAAFLARKILLSYILSGGAGASRLPGFFISSHALVSGMPLMPQRFKPLPPIFPEITPDRARIAARTDLLQDVHGEA